MKKLIIWIIAIVLVILLVWMGLTYFRGTAIDDLSTKVDDLLLNSYAGQVEVGLELYFFNNKIFPSTLDTLLDPPYSLNMSLENLKRFRYFTLAGGNDYDLCVDFSVKKNACGSSISKINRY